jgi:hypothetical protein
MGASFGSFFIWRCSSRKSVLLPTNILGTYGKIYCTSGYHWIDTNLPFFERSRRMRDRLRKRQWGRLRC